MARQFNDANSEFLLATATPLTGYPITMAAWFNSDDVANLQTIFGVANSASNDHFIRLAAAGSISGDPVRAHVDSGPNEIVDTTSGYTANTWHHALLTLTATDLDVYIDGGSTANGAHSLAWPTGLNRVAVGILPRSSPLHYMSGGVAEVALWDAALTEGERATQAAGYSALFSRPSALKLYAPLIHGNSASGGDDIDIFGLTLTDNATVTVADHPRIIRPSPTLWTPFAAAAAPSGNPWYYYAQQQAAGAA